MKRLHPILSLASLSAIVFFSACSDPSRGVEGAEVQESVEAVRTAPRAVSADAGAEAIEEEGSEPRRFFLGPDTTIEFAGSNRVWTQRGGFFLFDGDIYLPNGTIEGAEIDITIDTMSLYADDSTLEEVLQSEDFFKVEEYPVATFQSTNVVRGEDGNYRISGNLEMLERSNNITFPARIEVNDDELTAYAQFSIDRTNWNLGGTGPTDNLIRNQVVITLDIKAPKAD